MSSIPTFEQSFTHSINDAMKEAAIPLIDKAVEDIRKELLSRVNKMCAGIVEDNVSFERFGRDIRITVHLAKPNEKVV